MLPILLMRQHGDVEQRQNIHLSSTFITPAPTFFEALGGNEVVAQAGDLALDVVGRLGLLLGRLEPVGVGG